MKNEQEFVDDIRRACASMDKDVYVEDPMLDPEIARVVRESFTPVDAVCVIPLPYAVEAAVRKEMASLEDEIGGGLPVAIEKRNRRTFEVSYGSLRFKAGCDFKARDIRSAVFLEGSGGLVLEVSGVKRVPLGA